MNQTLAPHATPNAEVADQTPSACRADAEDTSRASANRVSGRSRIQLSRDGGKPYPHRDEHPIGEKLRSQPAAALIYDNTGCARTLCIDLNTPKGGLETVVRDIVLIPYDKALVSGVIRFDALHPKTQRAWLKAAAAVAKGL